MYKILKEGIILDDNTGIIYNNGKKLCNGKRFKDAYDFNDGIARVKDEYGRFYIKKDGTKIDKKYVYLERYYCKKQMELEQKLYEGIKNASTIGEFGELFTNFDTEIKILNTQKQIDINTINKIEQEKQKDNNIEDVK